MTDPLNPDLFSFASRRRDPDTSHAAADRHPKLRAGDRKSALFALFDNPDGLTDFELGDKINRQQTSAGKRRCELRDMGYVAATKERRPSNTGSPAIVWKLTDDGRKVAQEIER